MADRQSEELLSFYQSAYEKEKTKNAQLAGRLADEQRRADELQEKLDHIKNNPLWKATFPVRGLIHVLIRTKDRIKRYGNPKGLMRKLRNKAHEKKATSRYGTKSFPSKDEISRMRNTDFSKNIKFSILVPLWNTPEKFLREMIESVQWQVYENWELCLADGSDAAHAYVGGIVAKYMQSDSRIRYQKLSENKGIAGNTNECCAMASGDYIGLFDHDDILHPCALYEYMKVICDKGADYIYCDEATFHKGNINRMITLHFKSDYAVDTLRANNYICHFSVFSRTLLEGGELFRPQFDGSQDHDMILRLTDKAKRVVHVPKLLYYWRSHKASVASDISAKPYAIEGAKGAVAAHLTAHGFHDFEILSTRAFETIFRIKYALTAQPLVSILIPNKDHVSDLSRCIESILDKSTYDNYEIIVIENNSTTQEIRDYYDEIGKHPKIRVENYEGEFNYSKINNFGASRANGEYLLLLNNDTQVITLDWIEELLMYAQRDDVACVGAKLYYEDYTIQHAGIVIGLGAHRTAGHTHYKVNKENLGYMGKLCYAQDVSAVTGACLMVKKALFEEAGGLDEQFAVALNDVDFCLRMRKLGYLNVFTPFAELFHYESVSRGSDVSKRNAKRDAKAAAPGNPNENRNQNLDEADAAEAKRAARYNEEAARFREKWKDELAAGDPYFNPNFSLDNSDYVLY